MNAAEAFAVVEGYENGPGVSTPLPSYQSHKRVWALKIKEIYFDHQRRGANEETDGTAIIVPEEPLYAPFRVGSGYVKKHNPQAGGYWVQYEDGYESWSPAQAFEGGYTAIKPGENPHGVFHGIGWAVKQMQEGSAVRRSGWNGKGMFLFIVREDWKGTAKGLIPSSCPLDLTRSEFVTMKTADNKFVPWSCSQSDLLAFDWEISG